MARLRLGNLDEAPLLLWGIVSNLPAYKLCWLINQAMEWDLKRVDDIVLQHQPNISGEINLWGGLEKEDESFARYCHEDEGWLYKVDILANKAPSDILFPMLRNIDYLLIGHGEILHFPKDVKDILQKLDGIQTVLNLKPQQLKDSTRLQAYIE